MLSSLNNAVIKKGSYWGEYNITVDRGPRIRLNRAIVKLLLKNKVSVLWCYPDPTGPRMILCPDKHQNTYVELAKKHFPSCIDKQMATRKFICCGKSWELKSHGRIQIPPTCACRLRAERGTKLIIVGTGLWYEVWREDDWKSEINDSKGTL